MEAGWRRGFHPSVDGMDFNRLFPSLCSGSGWNDEFDRAFHKANRVTFTISFTGRAFQADTVFYRGHQKVYTFRAVFLAENGVGGIASTIAHPETAANLVKA